MDLKNDKEETLIDERGDAFADDFVGAASEVYLTEHPNPARQGCFSDLAIRQMAFSPKLPDDPVLDHLFECSECFREYRRALAATKQINLESSRSWREIIRVYAAKMAFAGLSLALVAALAFFAYVKLREQENPEMVKNAEPANAAPPFQSPQTPPADNRPENAPSAENDTTPGVQAEKPSENPRTNPPANSARKPSPKNESQNPPGKSLDDAVSLDLVLSDAGVLRNASGGRSNQGAGLVLPAGLVRLNIRLPEGFSDGRYKITVVDAFGKSLTGQSGTTKGGRLVSGNLDLRNRETQASKLCLQKNAETPDCYDLKVVR